VKDFLIPILNTKLYSDYLQKPPTLPGWGKEVSEFYTESLFARPYRVKDFLIPILNKKFYFELLFRNLPPFRVGERRFPNSNQTSRFPLPTPNLSLFVQLVFKK